MLGNPMSSFLDLFRFVLIAVAGGKCARLPRSTLTVYRQTVEWPLPRHEPRKVRAGVKDKYR
jgi:hypothetical protein